MLPSIELVSGLRSVHFHQGNSSGIIYAAYNSGVVTWWSDCDDRRLSWVAGAWPLF